MSLSHHQRKGLLAGIALLLLPAAFFPELIFAGKALIRSDLNWLHYPLRVLVAQNWRAGNWPLWDPYVLCGIPLLGEAQVGVLYPPNVLFVLPIPTHVALNLFVLLHLGMAALFTYLLARTLGSGRAGSILAGLAYGLGGVLMAQITQPNIMSGLAWIPLVLCLVVQATERRSAWWAVLAGLALALQVLTAQPQTLFYTAVLLLAFVVYATARSIRTRGWGLQALRPATTVALAGGVAAGLAAAQLLPTLELWQMSIRSHGVSYDQLTLFSMHPLQLLEFLVPNLFGNPVVTYQGLGDFCEYHAYVGLMPLFLAVATLRRQMIPHVRALSLLLVCALALSLGGYTPLYSVLQHVPGFDLFRVPARWVAPASLALALLAGFGLDDLAAKGRAGSLTKTLLWVMGATAVLMLGAALLVWLGRPQAEEWAAALSAPKEVQRLLTAALQRFLLPARPNAENWLPNVAPWTTIPGLIFFLEVPVAVALLVGHARGRLRTRSLSYALIGLTLLDLLAAEGSAVTQLGNGSFWQYDTGVIELVREKAGAYRADVIGTEVGRHADQQNEAEPAHQAIYWLTRYTPVMLNVASPTGYYSPLRLGRYEDFNRDVPTRRAIDMTSTKVLLTWGKPTHDQEASLREIYSAGMLHVYDNPTALPHAYLAHRIEVVPDAQSALLRLTKSDYDPAQSTVIEGPLSDISPSGAGISPANIRLYSSQRVIVDSESSQDGMLVLTDSYYPGWRALVDGRETPIYHGNYLFRAVPVPAGKHTVEFVYFADAFKIGLLVSGATAASLLVAASLRARRKRRLDEPAEG